MAAGWGIAFLLSATVAHAQEPDASEPTPEVLDEARLRFEQGRAHYAAGRYEEAVASFQRSYDLCGRSGLLFNLASVYERLGEYSKAAEFLRRYLETPDVEDVVSVRERLRRLELTLAQPAESPPSLGVTATSDSALPSPVSPLSPPVDVPEASRASSWPTWVLGGATVAAGATAATFGILTLDSRSQLEDRCGMEPGGTNICRQGTANLIDQERQRALVTDVALGATAALGTVTVIAAAVSANNRKDRSVRLVPALRPDGVQVVLVTR